MSEVLYQKLGLAVEPRAGGISGLAELAQHAERARLGGFYAMEAWRETIVPTTLCAEQTRRIALGTAVMQIYPVNPVMVAIQAAELQELSNGRFTLGLGSGGKFVVPRWFGVPHDRPLQRMREFVEIIRGVLSSVNGRPFSYSGEIFSITKYRLDCPPVPKIPINVAAVGPRMQELAGQVADGVMIGPLHSPAYLDQVRDRVAKAARHCGRGSEDIRIYHHLITACHTDIEQALILARRSIIYLAQHEPYLRRFTSLGFGSEAQRINELVRIHAYKPAEALVTDKMLESITVFGSPVECRRQIECHLQTGARPILMLIPFQTPAHQVIESHNLLLKELEVS